MTRTLVFSVLLLAACGRAETTALSGYVEADYLYLAPQDAGIVKTLSVREGDRVSAGDIVFTLDPARMSMAAEQATAAAESAKARAADDGAMAQQIVEAEAALRLAEQTFRRSRDLVKDGAVAREKYDADAASLAAAKARLDRARAEREAMQGEWDSMSAAARLAERRLADLATAAPAAGVIERIYRRPGEVVGAGEPVASLLPPENMKLRFFAPEPMLAKMEIGAAISFACDSCAQIRTAKISYVASEPQFTPPVIYSIEEREKLVFLVEARPDDPSGLRPGLPVTVEPPR
ncbi:MAG TPA: secretion protein HlyD [Parvularcula sp.]|nr:secretion protein HlyD [Parvularcula sp.]HBS33788.1 secretion protein HlyD [Parvularcula sp.]